MRMLRGCRLPRARGIVLAAAMLLLACGRGRAEPIVLKLSFYTSDRSTIYQCQVKPFVDAVNADGAGFVKIEVYFSGAISSSLADQPNLVRSGQADLAAIVPGARRTTFPTRPCSASPDCSRTTKKPRWCSRGWSMPGL